MPKPYNHPQNEINIKNAKGPRPQYVEFKMRFYPLELNLAQQALLNELVSVANSLGDPRWLKENGKKVPV